MKQQRKRRVDEALRHVLAEGVEELSDPAVGFVTVTGVDVTADLEHATVWVSVLGGDEAAGRGVARAGSCQRHVAVQGGPGAALAEDSRPDLSV